MKNKSDKEWKEKLSPEQYNILREKGTEPPFSGELYTNKEDGTYLCAACGNKLFKSDTKYESGSGWPSFYEPLSKDAINEESDDSRRDGGHPLWVRNLFIQPRNFRSL